MEWLHSGSSWPSQRRIVDELANRYIYGKCGGFLVPAGPDLPGSSNCQYSRALDNVRDPVCMRHQTYVLVVISERFRNHGGNSICQIALGGSPSIGFYVRIAPQVWTASQGNQVHATNLGTQKNKLASKYVVTTDDCLYKICVRCVPSTWLACPNDIQKHGLLP
jgi:hypothetical protein